jgi:carboxypeptidase Q
VMVLRPSRVPLLGVSLDMSHYFDVHHSAADTLEKIDPANLQRSAAALATMAFVLADQEASWRAEVPATPNP